MHAIVAETADIAPAPSERFGVVAIGRNEGERLRLCLSSATDADLIIYVDSGSSDGSVERARGLGVEVVNLDLSIPFTAARARNAGLKRLLELCPDTPFIQFVDGDCELDPFWCRRAAHFLEQKPSVAAVCGRLRERYPDRSVYNWMCEREWEGPLGEIKACAGNVMMRSSALVDVGGYREDVIAAEEDELCVRLREANWRIWRLADEMALHDAAMLKFGQWWTRAIRAGYAFAQGAYLHGGSPERHFVRECRRAAVWGLAIPTFWILSIVWIGPLGTLWLLVYPIQFARLTWRGKGPLADNATIAFFQLLGRFPETIGLLRFLGDRLAARSPTIIEHKVCL